MKGKLVLQASHCKSKCFLCLWSVVSALKVIHFYTPDYRDNLDKSSWRIRAPGHGTFRKNRLTSKRLQEAELSCGTGLFEWLVIGNPSLKLASRQTPKSRGGRARQNCHKL